jgi:hypothetical protein
MSDTPRTDAAFKLEAFFDGVGIVETIPVEFARQLETDLADKDKLIEQMREALHLADDLIDEYAADYEHRDNVDEIRDEIKAALAAERR